MSPFFPTNVKNFSPGLPEVFRGGPDLPEPCLTPSSGSHYCLYWSEGWRKEEGGFGVRQDRVQPIHSQLSSVRSISQTLQVCFPSGATSFQATEEALRESKKSELVMPWSVKIVFRHFEDCVGSSPTALLRFKFCPFCAVPRSPSQLLPQSF